MGLTIGEILSRESSLMCSSVLPPTNFRVTGKGTDYIDLAWEEPNNGKRSTQYLILYQEIGANKLAWTQCHDVIGTSYRLRGLKESTYYFFVIHSVCDGILSEERKLLYDKTERPIRRTILGIVGGVATAVGAGAAILATGGAAAVVIGDLIVGLGAEAVGALVTFGGVVAAGVTASIAGVAAGVEIGKRITEVLDSDNLTLLKTAALLAIIMAI